MIRHDIALTPTDREKASPMLRQVFANTSALMIPVMLAPTDRNVLSARLLKVELPFITGTFRVYT